MTGPLGIVRSPADAAACRKAAAVTEAVPDVIVGAIMFFLGLLMGVLIR